MCHRMNKGKKIDWKVMCRPALLHKLSLPGALSASVRQGAGKSRRCPRNNELMGNQVHPQGICLELHRHLQPSPGLGTSYGTLDLYSATEHLSLFGCHPQHHIHELDMVA